MWGKEKPKKPEPALEVAPFEEFKSAVSEGITTALSLIEERFPISEYTNEYFAYHNKRHTEEVVARTNTIFNAAQRVETTNLLRKQRLACLAAAFHDTVQAFEEVSKDGAVKRVRPAGKNEAASAEEAEAFMRGVNSEYAPRSLVVFTEDDILTVRRAIMLTVPSFDGGTVVQNGITDAPLVERAVALADLGGYGMEASPKRALENACEVFREERLDIARAIDSGEEIGAEKQDAFKADMRVFLQNQAIFLKGRKNRLGYELLGLPEGVQSAIKEEFKYFDDNLKEVEELYKDSGPKSVSFGELARAFGYRLPGELATGESSPDEED